MGGLRGEWGGRGVKGVSDSRWFQFTTNLPVLPSPPRHDPALHCSASSGPPPPSPHCYTHDRRRPGSGAQPTLHRPRLRDALHRHGAHCLGCGVVGGVGESVGGWVGKGKSGGEATLCSARAVSPLRAWADWKGLQAAHVAMHLL